MSHIGISETGISSHSGDLCGFSLPTGTRTIFQNILRYHNLSVNFSIIYIPSAYIWGKEILKLLPPYHGILPFNLMWAFINIQGVSST